MGGFRFRFPLLVAVALLAAFGGVLDGDGGGVAALTLRRVRRNVGLAQVSSTYSFTTNLIYFSFGILTALNKIHSHVGILSDEKHTLRRQKDTYILSEHRQS